jgi:hypothetical protein
MSLTIDLETLNLGISQTEWTKYKHLIRLRRAENLTNQEHETLILLGNKIEQANSKRLQYVFDLSKLKGVSLEKMIHDLGIKPVEIGL